MVLLPTRVEYKSQPLNKSDLDKDPLRQFEKWWHEAVFNNVHLVDAVHLSTVDENGFPNARIVLLKNFSKEGFVFYTNYKSPKAIELLHCPQACMVIFWPKLERQIRIKGKVEKINKNESIKYFQQRPRNAQLGAWASIQSSIISSRKKLEEAYSDAQQKFSNQDFVTCPDYWGGMRLKPDYFEFWQGRESRLHDRFQYRNDKNQNWIIERLAP